MAMIKCKECGAEISTKAESCPQCGAKRSKGGGNLGCGTLILVLFAGILIMGLIGQDDTPKKPRLSDAECQKDLQCWGDRQMANATAFCRAPIERLARYDFRWTDGMLGSKFTHFRWIDQEQGHLQYQGDSIRFQNGFGAWQTHRYTCDFAPATRTVLKVTANPGRRP